MQNKIKAKKSLSRNVYLTIILTTSTKSLSVTALVLRVLFQHLFKWDQITFYYTLQTEKHTYVRNIRILSWNSRCWRHIIRLFIKYTDEKITSILADVRKRFHFRNLEKKWTLSIRTKKIKKMKMVRQTCNHIWFSKVLIGDAHSFQGNVIHATKIYIKKSSWKSGTY